MTAKIEVLRLLERYIALPSLYVSQLLGISHSYAKTFIYPELRRKGLIALHPGGLAHENARRRHAVICRTDAGRLYLARLGLYEMRRPATNQFKHDLLGDLGKASCEYAPHEIQHLSLITGKDILASDRCPAETKDDPQPWRIKTPTKIVEPDDELLGYKYAPPGAVPGYLFFMREDDRHTESLATIRYKMEGYLEIERLKLYKARYGIPRCLFIWQTIDEGWMHSMMRVLLKLTDGKGSPQFLFTTVTDYAGLYHFPPLTAHMATRWYKRAGVDRNGVPLSDFNIIEDLKAASRLAA